MPSVHIIFASTSGHTEYVVDQLLNHLKTSRSDLALEKQQAEKTAPEDFLKSDLLILASSTWNTGNVEGQLNPHMHHLLMDIAKTVDLTGKKVACVGLGDVRYHYTCKAADRLEEFVKTHGGTLVEPTLRIINEPYGQEATVTQWASSLSLS